MDPDAERKSFDKLQEWAYRFLKRQNLSLKRVSRKVHLGDDELESRLTSFLAEVEQIRLINQATVFVNMDETAVYYDSAPRITVDFVGSDAVPCAGSGSSDRVTAVLAIASDGRKLPPYIIFKGMAGGRIARELASSRDESGNSSICSVQSHAWMDEQQMLNWIDR